MFKKLVCQWVKFPYERSAHNIAKFLKLLYQNETINLSHKCQTEFLNIGLRNWFCSCHVWRDRGKSSRVEGQKSLYTVGVSADSANVWLQCFLCVVVMPAHQVSVVWIALIHPTLVIHSTLSVHHYHLPIDHCQHDTQGLPCHCHFAVLHAFLPLFIYIIIIHMSTAWYKF